MRTSPLLRSLFALDSLLNAGNPRNVTVSQRRKSHYMRLKPLWDVASATDAKRSAYAQIVIRRLGASHRPFGATSRCCNRRSTPRLEMLLTKSLSCGQMLTIVVGKNLADLTLSIQLSNLLSTSIPPSS